MAAAVQNLKRARSEDHDEVQAPAKVAKGTADASPCATAMDLIAMAASKQSTGHIPPFLDIPGYRGFVSRLAARVAKLHGISAEEALREFERFCFIKRWCGDWPDRIVRASTIMDEMWVGLMSDTIYYETLQKRLGMKLQRRYKEARTVRLSQSPLALCYHMFYKTDYLHPKRQKYEWSWAKKLEKDVDRRTVIVRFNSTFFAAVELASMDTPAEIIPKLITSSGGRLKTDHITPAVLNCWPSAATVAHLWPDHKRVHIWDFVLPVKKRV